MLIFLRHVGAVESWVKHDHRDALGLREIRERLNSSNTHPRAHFLHPFKKKIETNQENEWGLRDLELLREKHGRHVAGRAGHVVAVVTALQSHDMFKSFPELRTQRECEQGMQSETIHHT